MPHWLSDLLANSAFTALAGVIVGAVGSYFVGVRLAYNERRRLHGAAVRAVFYELGELLTLAEHPQPHRQPSTATYDALVMPLFTDLPDSVVADVAYAYGLVHMLGADPTTLPQLVEEIKAARKRLLTHGKTTLHMGFEEPAS